VDLGAWWKGLYGLPLPLGANALSRALPPEVQAECCGLMRASIQYALDHHEEALHYALEFARGLEPSLTEKFIGMYVNHYTLDAGELVSRAAQKLLDLGYEAGLLPERVDVKFVR
jgi:1,4-dihydroxy-6-naphthoate synthase